MRGPKEKKRAPGCSTEEMKEKPNTDFVEDAEELRKWRCLNQNEIDLCWKNLAERMEEEVLDMYKVEESKRQAFRGWRSTDPEDRRRGCQAVGPL